MKAKLYPYYSHRRDPVLDNLNRALRGTNKKTLADKAGVSKSTLAHWSGKGKKMTMRPKFTTIVAVARAGGPEAIQAVIDTIKKGK